MGLKCCLGMAAIHFVSATLCLNVFPAAIPHSTAVNIPAVSSCPPSSCSIWHKCKYPCWVTQLGQLDPGTTGLANRSINGITIQVKYFFYSSNVPVVWIIYLRQSLIINFKFATRVWYKQHVCGMWKLEYSKVCESVVCSYLTDFLPECGI